jgi:hypothetical protein
MMKRKHCRDERQLERRRKAFSEQVGHFARLTQRAAEISADSVADRSARTGHRTADRGPGRCGLLLLFGRRILAHHERDRIAGEVEQAERNERHDRENDRRLQDPSQDESEHVD